MGKETKDYSLFGRFGVRGRFKLTYTYGVMAEKIGAYSASDSSFAGNVYLYNNSKRHAHIAKYMVLQG